MACEGQVKQNQWCGRTEDVGERVQHDGLDWANVQYFYAPAPSSSYSGPLGARPFPEAWIGAAAGCALAL